MVDTVLADKSKFGVSNPSPENNLFFSYEGEHFLSRVEVIELNNGSSTSFLSTDNNDVAFTMHDLGINWHGLTLKLEVLTGINHNNIVTILDGDVFLRFKRENLVFE